VTTISDRTLNGKTDALDALYNNILNVAYKESDAGETKDITYVLRAVISARNPLSIMLLGITRDRIRAALSSPYTYHLLEIVVSLSQHFMRPSPITLPTMVALGRTSLIPPSLTYCWPSVVSSRS